MGAFDARHAKNENSSLFVFHLSQVAPGSECEWGIACHKRITKDVSVSLSDMRSDLDKLHLAPVFTSYVKRECVTGTQYV